MTRPLGDPVLQSAVEEEITKSLALIARESFGVDYGTHGAGGFGSVVAYSDALHALLFVRKALRDAGQRGAAHVPVRILG